ncbi:MAG TPA: alpha/beta family hydrolase [Stellaceae bacterium]|nr:alpha/beta family hydrolase [Stellaceae bacterium]
MTEATPFSADGVQGFLHRPPGNAQGGGVLTHGAGGNCRAPLLVAAAAALADAGFVALRCDLPFRRKRPTGPPSPAGAAADRAGLRAAVAALRLLSPGAMLLGGQSYGGRQATLLVADEPGLVDGLLLFSYPLHPPGRPERPRTEHFPRLSAPCVFVHGTADPFATSAELRAAITAIPAATTVIEIVGAGHDLRRGRFDLAPVAAAALRLVAG